MKNWNAVIEVIKTVKNYTIPLIGSGIVFLQSNCNQDVLVLGGFVTFGAVLAYIQSAILKNSNIENDVNVFLKRK